MGKGSLRTPWPSMFDHLKLGVVMFDQEHGGVHLNPVASSMLGYQAEHDQGIDI